MTSPSPPPQIPPSSPPQPRCLELLPAELLENIVDHTTVHSRQTPHHRRREKTLLSLCLTSKRLLSFAQPALFSNIKVKNKQDAEAVLMKSDLLASCSTLDVHVETLEVEPQEYDSDSSTDDFSCVDPSTIRPYIRATTRIAEATTHLQSLTCYGSIALFEPFLGTFLKKLGLDCLEFPSDTVLALPHLEQLTLMNIILPVDPPLQHRLPSLRHLAIYCHYGWKNGRMLDAKPFDAFLKSLAPQLTSMSASIDTTAPTQASIWNVPTLSFQYHCGRNCDGFVDSRKAQIKLLCLDLERSTKPEVTLDMHYKEYPELKKEWETQSADDVGWKVWKKIIETAGGPNFPLECVTINPRNPDHLRLAHKRFFKTCQQRNIEILEEIIGDYFPFGTVISPNFVKWSEERRRRVEEGLNGK